MARGFSAANAAFEIASLSPIFWVDPSDTTTLFADTAATTPATFLVARQNDISGNNYNALSSTSSNRPRTGTRTFNSKNVLDYFDSSDTMNLDASLYGLPSGSNTIILVCAADTADFEHIIYGSNSGTKWGVRYQGGSNGGVVATNGSGAKTLAFSPGTSQNIIGMRRAGTDIDSFAAGNIASGVGATDITVTELRISNGFNGAISEVLFFNKYLTNTEINQIASIYSAKYSCPWTPFPQYGARVLWDDGSGLEWDGGIPVEW